MSEKERDLLIRALARGDGQSMSGFDSGHTGEMMYGSQADQVELVIAKAQATALREAALAISHEARSVIGFVGAKHERRGLNIAAESLRAIARDVSREAQERFDSAPLTRRRAAMRQVLALGDAGDAEGAENDVQRTDGVCTCEAQVIESGTRGVLILPDKLDPRCVQHGPGGVFELATADDVIEGRARYADTAGGRADRETLAKEAGE